MAIAIGWRPNDSAAHNFLTRWALVHDVPEAVTGDIPTPMKAHYDHKKLEQSVRVDDGEWTALNCLFTDGQALGPETREVVEDVRRIVKFCDLLDAAIYLREEVDMGNRDELTHKVRVEIRAKLLKAGQNLPADAKAVNKFYNQHVADMI